MSVPSAAPSRHASLRFLEPLAASTWVLFLLWSVLVAALWISGFGEVQSEAWVAKLFHLPPPVAGGVKSALQESLVTVLRSCDAIWVVLAALNVYAFTAAEEGLATARRWGLLILVIMLAVACASVRTGWPLGPVIYTKRLGGQFLGVPFGLPLLWFSVIVGARDLLLQWQPMLSRSRLAFSSAALVLFFDFALEPVAWKLRVFWLWWALQLNGAVWPPLQNYLSIFILGGLLTYALRSSGVGVVPKSSFRTPGGVFMLLFLVLTAGNLARLWRGGH